METATRIAAVRERVHTWRMRGERVAFVPTMGNLHAGHISLIDTARRHGQRFIASIFVNPMQFGPNEDFAHYPRTPARDESMLAQAGCDLMFMPDVAEIYPNGFENATHVVVPVLSDILCGEFRPGHFQGVSTVVAKLFAIVQPDVAVFGQKDYQQLTVIRRMVADLCMPVEILGAPTVREANGLAMSSRNQYLTVQERHLAPKLYQTLQGAIECLRSGRRDYGTIEEEGMQELAAAGFTPQYFSVRDARDLNAPGAQTREFAVLAAALLGKARLIDNLRIQI